MSSSTSSPRGTAPCWLSKTPVPAPTTCSSPRTARSWAGSTWSLPETALRNSATGSRSTPPAAAVRELCRLAPARHGLRTLRAATSRENTASQKVLTKAGFAAVGPADPAHIGGKQGTWYQRDLATSDAPQQRAAARDQAGD